MSLSEMDFPAPLAPRMIFVWPRRSSKLTSRSTTVSSNASDTCSKTMIGSFGPGFGASATALRVCSVLISIKQRNHQARDEEVEDEHGDRCRHDGVRGR